MIKNLPKYYNNPVDSDVVITLDKHTHIHAHRVVLKCSNEYFSTMLDTKMSETDSGVISFPTHTPDAITAVIKYYYGIELNIVTIDEYIDIYKLAQFIMDTDLVTAIENITIPSITYEIFMMAILYSSDRIMGKIVYAVKCDKVTIDSVCKSLEQYEHFRNMWLLRDYPQGQLFLHDCDYLGALYPDNCLELYEHLGSFMNTLSDSFTEDELIIIKSHPLVIRVPLLSKLFGLVTQQNWYTIQDKVIPTLAGQKSVTIGTYERPVWRPDQRQFKPW